ncbi:uncharacterized protein LOC121376151 [Gigantopelta aegis]|uniref:uncharacterized protein LOC121376151 n=1 Tax=Gigantopelta aegis TaxID=1735272 RepID=UPI001B888D0A|nr:uncharacterized protein LOC121376151 [Gigantopelta aegis]
MENDTSLIFKEETLNKNTEFSALTQACRIVLDAERNRAEAYNKAARLFFKGGRKIGINNVSRRLGKQIKMVADDLNGVWSENKTMINMLDVISTQNKESLMKLQESGETNSDARKEKCYNAVVSQYEDEECKKLNHLKMALIEFLDRLEVTLPRITFERAGKGSHFCDSWVDLKRLNTEDIVKQRISHLLSARRPTCDLSKDDISCSNSSFEEQQNDHSNNGRTNTTACHIPVALMSNVTVIATDNFKRFERNQISLRRGMILKQILAANQDGYAHGYKTSGKFYSDKKYGYYPANKVVLYEPKAMGEPKAISEPRPKGELKPIGDWKTLHPPYSQTISSSS